MGEGFIVRKGGAGGVTFSTYDELEQIARTDSNILLFGLSNIVSDNDFLYGISFGGGTLGASKFHQGNLAFIGNTSGYAGSGPFYMRIDNDFLYIGGAGNATSGRDVKKYHKSNLSFVGNTNSYGNSIRAIAVDNDFVYASGFEIRSVKKWHKGNFAFVGNTNALEGQAIALQVDNDFIYAGWSNILKYHKGNLAFVNQTTQYGDGFGGGSLVDFAIDNDFIYAVGAGSVIRGFHKGNLAKITTTGFNDNSVSNTYEFFLNAISLDNDFVYIIGQGNQTAGRDIKKYHKSNLAFVANSQMRFADNNTGKPLFAENNDFVYCVGADNSNGIHKYSKENNTTDPSFPVIEDNSRKYYLKGEGL